MGKVRDVPEEVADQAIHWLLVLQSGGSPAQREQWLAWRQAAEDHERAWQRIEEVNATLRTLPPALALRAMEAAPAPGRREFIKGMAVLGLLGGAGWVAQEQQTWRQWVAHYRTGVGERRSLHLAAGLQLELNTDTAVNHHPQAARLELVAGEALLVTDRPLRLDTPQGWAELGAGRFVVRDYADFSLVSALQGEARLHPARAGDTQVLPAGWCCRLYPYRLGDAMQVDDLSLAWLRGMLVADDLSLSAFLAEMARYCTARVSCSPTAAGLRVSGTYPLAEPEAVWAALVRTLPVRRGGLGGFWVRFDLA